MTLPYDVSRCAGRMDLLPEGHWCKQRDSCMRYLSFIALDREAGIEDYRNISVVMARPECGIKIEASQQ